MSKTLSLGSRARASMAMLASAMGAVAPVATVAPSAGAPGTPNISRPAPQAPQTQAMTQAQAVRASQAIGIHPGFNGFRGGPSTGIHTFPAWNQRKARKASRQTGRKIQKRYKR